jgi:hypothetical protein
MTDTENIKRQQSMTNIEKKTQMTAEYNKYEKKQTNDNRI